MTQMTVTMMVAGILHSVSATTLCSWVLYSFTDMQTGTGKVTPFTSGTLARRVVGIAHWKWLQRQTFVGLAYTVPGGYPEPVLQAS